MRRKSRYLTSKRSSRAMKMPGMTMSPRPSMAKLLAARPFSSRSWGNTTEGGGGGTCYIQRHTQTFTTNQTNTYWHVMRVSEHRARSLLCDFLCWTNFPLNSFIKFSHLSGFDARQRDHAPHCVRGRGEFQRERFVKLNTARGLHTNKCSIKSIRRYVTSFLQSGDCGRPERVFMQNLSWSCCTSLKIQQRAAKG